VNDHPRFAAGSDDGVLRSWAAKTGDMERQFDQLGAQGIPRVLRYSPDGSRVVALLEDRNESRASMVYLASGASTLIGDAGVRVVHAAFSPDGSRLATMGSDMIVRMWTGTDNHEEQSFRGGLFTPREIQWTRDGRRLIVRSNVAVPCVSVWYAGALPDIYALRASNSPVRCARFSPDGERVVVASDDGSARVWATPALGASVPAAPEAGELLFSLSHEGAVRDATYSPDGKWIATASADGSARLWSASSGEERRTLLEGGSALASIAFSSDGAFVAVRSDEGQVFLCDPTGARTSRLLETQDPATALVWLPTQAELVTAHGTNVLRILRASDGALVEAKTWEDGKRGFPTGAVALAARADGGEIALACADGWARFFAPSQTKESMYRILIITPQSIEYSHDGSRLLVTGSSGRGAVRLQDLEEARKFTDASPKASETGSVTGMIGMEVLHTGDVTGGSLSPDGLWMISTAKSGGAIVRNTQDGTPFAHFQGPPGASCFAPAISPGNGPARALVAFDDGSVWVWPLDPLPAALARKPRELNELELEKERESRPRSSARSTAK
jgi:WD40 repeat protein